MSRIDEIGELTHDGRTCRVSVVAGWSSVFCGFFLAIYRDDGSGGIDPGTEKIHPDENEHGWIYGTFYDKTLDNVAGNVDFLRKKVEELGVWVPPDFFDRVEKSKPDT